MEQIAVGLAQQNPLAIPTLERLLRQNNIIVHSNEGVLLRKAAAGVAVSVVILDVGALSVPLRGYIQNLRHLQPGSKILLLGNNPTDSSLLLMLEFGVHGFVRYVDAKRSLLKAIYVIVRNELWFPAKIVNQFTAGAKQPKERWKSLTARERLIVRLLEKRLSNKEIAVLLNVSENTIKFHLANLFRKLEVHDRQSVIIAAFSRKLRGEFNHQTGETSPLTLPSHSYGVQFGHRRRSPD
ncbi:MAG: response regulator transcription factor [Candidatus Sulfotelmatobacter sp.]|jgi:DNA-binding NarL/FixJ family response regulator